MSLLPHLHTVFSPFSSSLISVMVSADVKHHVYILATNRITNRKALRSDLPFCALILHKHTCISVDSAAAPKFCNKYSWLLERRVPHFSYLRHARVRKVSRQDESFSRSRFWIRVNGPHVQSQLAVSVGNEVGEDKTAGGISNR